MEEFLDPRTSHLKISAAESIPLLTPSNGMVSL